MAPPDRELQQIDRYQLVKRIGKGGMAQVFHARLQRIGGFERDVAVKVLLPEYSSEPEFVEMLLDEARIAGSIGHPCIVQVIDVGREGEQFYLVMEHVDGSDLRSLLRALPHGRLPVEMALYITCEVLRGLAAVHGAVDRTGKPRGIIHRDVSPANVLVDRSGVVKLSDFGIARAAVRLSKTRHGAVKGKLRYMAPEQLDGRPVDHRADLYAVGIVLAELLLGDLEGEPKRMTSFGPVFRWSRRIGQGKIPADVLDVIDRGVAENPARRYSDAAEFRRALAAALHKRSPGYSAEELGGELRALGLQRGGSDDATEVGKTPSGRPGPAETAQAGGETTAPALFAEEQRTTAPSAPSARNAMTAPSARNAASGADAPSTEGLAWADIPELPPVGVLELCDGDLIAATGEARFPSSAPPIEKISSGALGRRLARAWRVTKRRLLTPRGGLVAGAAAATILALVLALSIGASAARPPSPAPIAAVAAAPLPAPRVSTGTLTVEGPSGASVTIGATSYPPAPCSLELPPGDYAVKLKKRARARAVVRHVTIEAGRAVSLRL